MSMRRLQGWALIVSALIDLVALVKADSPLVTAIFIIGALLFILGVPVIQSVQDGGTAALVGTILLELGAIIVLVVNIMMLSGNSGFSPAIPFASALAGVLGRFIVGWITTQRKVFTPWVGWAFIIEGLLNFLGGILQLGALAPVIGIVVPLVGAAALFGYGWGVVRYAS